MKEFLIFLFGFSVTLNIVLSLILAILIRVKFFDCGNIFHFFKDDRVANNIVNKTILDDDF